MTYEPDSPEAEAEEVLEELWNLAVLTCEQIEAYQPDIVIGLCHRGQIPLRATQALWEETRSEPFPPSMLTNIGREKTTDFNKLYKRLHGGPFIEWVSGPEDAGYYLAWISEHIAWQDELRAQAQAVLGARCKPSRILVIDDFVHEGETWLLALGLLKDTFPHADAILFAGNLDGSLSRLTRLWLASRYPSVYERILAPQEERAGLPALYQIAKVMPGTEDVDPMSLAWRPITADSPLVQQLSDYLPAEALLELPAWAYAFVDSYVRRRARESGSLEVPETVRSQTGRAPYRLTSTHLLFRHIWRHRRITLAEASWIASPSEAASMLWRLKESGFLAARGEDMQIDYYELAHRYGLMLYGPQRLEPGDDIAWATEGRATSILTPFSVEYALSDGSRGGAPVLVPVPDDCGAPVPADVLRVRPDMDEFAAEDVACPRAPRTFAGDNVSAPSDLRAEPETGLRAGYVLDFAGFEKLFYVTGDPNLDFVLQPEISVEEKASRLAHLAVQSVTPETFAERRDGIWYLHQAILSGAQTPLTEPYKQAILRLVGEAQGLLDARERIAARFAPPDTWVEP